MTHGSTLQKWTLRFIRAKSARYLIQIEGDGPWIYRTEVVAVLLFKREAGYFVNFGPFTTRICNSQPNSFSSFLSNQAPAKMASGKSRILLLRQKGPIPKKYAFPSGATKLKRPVFSRGLC